MINPFKKDSEANKDMPMGLRLMKGCFTTMVSITTGSLAGGLFDGVYNLKKQKNDPTVPPTE